MLTPTIDVYRRRIERIATSGVDLAALPDALLETLDDAIGFDAICSATLDPATLVPTSIGLHGDRPVPVAMPDPLTVTLSAPVHAGTRALASASAPHPVEILSHVFDGDAERSPFYQHVLAPQGFQHSLRAMLVSHGACWGVLTFLRRVGRRDFTAADAEIAEALTPGLAHAVRRSILAHRDADGAHPEQPGIVVLDESLAVASISESARRWLAELSDTAPALPAVVRSVGAAALLDAESDGGAHPRARVRTRSGTWLHVHATALHGSGSRTVAVILDPAHRDHVSAVIARAYGLTTRERQVAALAIDGANNIEIADRLVIARYTVQDHLKAAFDKVGVRNRRDLAHALSSHSARRPPANQPTRGTAECFHPASPL